MIKYIVISAITVSVAAAGIISKINDVVSLPHNIRQLFQLIFHKSGKTGFSYYFESQESLIDFKLRNYCNRVIYDEHDNAILGIVDTIRGICDQDKSGYIYIEGKRKTGKTVLAAFLARELKAPHHFVSVQESRDDKDLIVKSIIEQICKKTKTNCPTLSDNSELNAILGSTLTVFSKYAKRKKTPQFIVFDGIDTLEDGWLENLPEYLPKGVFIIAICEKTPTDEGIKRFYLRRFTYAETKALLGNTGLSEAEIDEVHDRLDGNPCTIGYFAEHFRPEAGIDEQLEDAIYSLNIDKMLRKMPEEDLDFMLFLSVAFGPIPLNDILDIVKTDRSRAERIIENNHNFVLDDRNGIMLIDDEIAGVLNNPGFLTSEEEHKREEYHNRIISYYESKECEYSLKYLIYHHHQMGQKQKILDLLSTESTLTGVFEERRRFVISLIQKNTDIDPLYRDMINSNKKMLWEYVFSSMKYVMDNRKDYSCLRRIVNIIDKDKLAENEKGIASYFEAVCMRKEGEIDAALTQLENINPDTVSSPFDIWIMIQQADCAREIGQVKKANDLYGRIIATPDFRTKQPQEYWECQLKIIDRKYCDGLYKQTLALDDEAKKECRRLLLYNLMLKFYKEDAQVYNDMCMYDQTISLLEEAIGICDSVKNNGMKGELYNLLSISESNQSTTNGKRTASKAYELNLESRSIIEQGKSKLALGMALYREHDYPAARIAYSEAMSLFESSGYRSGMARIEHELAKVCYREGNAEDALGHIERSGQLLVRDYGVTHRIYEYKNQLLVNLVKNIPLSKDTFKDCPPVEFVTDQKKFIESYSAEVNY